MAGESFSLRRDRNGLRPVYSLNDEGAHCPYRCEFCTVWQTPLVTPEENRREFDRQHANYLSVIDGPYHPLIYNQGNVTNPAEFSTATLEHIFRAFDGDERVVFVSLNSRQRFVTERFLESLLRLDLTFPIRFIFGLESFSSRAKDLFGKDTRGELERFINLLRPFNRRPRPHLRAGYEFGLDVNLVFLPEMYLSDGTDRVGHDTEVAAGMRWELRQLLAATDPLVPVEINLHPYYRVNGLPFADMDLDLFMRELPSLESMVEEHNQAHPERSTHLFVGVEGAGYESKMQKAHLFRWKETIEAYNATGVLSAPS